MQVKLDGPKILQPQTIANILDYLARKPFIEVQVLIGDVMTQLKLQEGGNDGSQLNRSGETFTGRGNSSSSGGGIPPVQGERSDNGT